ncbi:MerR family transcriptional regulator [Bogoriella caseilytica]|uniref:DNA-binding transcriptional MerR regulator n=1 Tax=Bogoriella caseilytica TaxID=56055 RepID=A0A3N2BCK5_9MICO|nr:MerR family transcriptional regulator [Bogoriella caseilytica]ROR72979.1 DNA-binding transcriptional MerR regulator [Bogoriella caseilytica]
MKRAGSAPEQSTMHIGAVAERAGMSLRSLRHYDEVGLLTPSGRSAGGFRLYTDDDVERLMLIRRMKPLGFSLDAMRELLELTDHLASGSDTEAQRRLEEFIADAESRREELARTLEMADEFIERLHGQSAQRS